MSDRSTEPKLESSYSPWSLAESSACLQLEKLQAQIELTQPAAGLSFLKAGHEALPGNILQVSLGVESSQRSVQNLTDSYIRQRDLIADYPARERFPFRSWVYWRTLPTDEHVAIAAIETIVSTQTDLLDSHPQVSVASALPATELWQLKSLEKAEFKQISLARSETQYVHHSKGLGCYLWRLSGDRWSYAEMIPPSDFHTTEINQEAEGLVSVSHRLFERTLEKGVILRARVRGIFLERGRDAANVLNWYQTMLGSELPLTT